MSNPDPRAQRLIASHLQRVLIVDPNAAPARLLGDLLKQLGAKYVHVEATHKGAMEACPAIQPQMIFTELTGPALDGLAFVRELRDSGLACRKVPITVVTADATAQTITASRDAGVHEFLRKPFTIKDLTRRVEAVTLKPRPWVEAVRYIGPDRRRFNSGDYQGPRKRKSDSEAPTIADRITQALKILRAAIDAIDTNPAQALRSMMAQVADLQAVAAETNDIRLAEAALALQSTLRTAAASGKLTRAELENGALGLWGFKSQDEAKGPAKSAA
ncbi:response regulator transcription factor [Phenylobacterium montanum]|uniref:Response regulator n=1 Tax=Phenylobacterium montanum TaxID=2823693 RepID=A0A975FVX6_9CAUL|nr:response regulator [Caulobacter sp. S6]QUD86360.1 response regulator [Caulobacter sp. S6]